jgi:UPF0755 protein
MPDRRGRTREEREAARLEREAARQERKRRRAGRSGSPPSQQVTEPVPPVEADQGELANGRAPEPSAPKPSAADLPAADLPAAEPPAARPRSPGPVPEPDRAPDPVSAERVPQPAGVSSRPMVGSFPSPPDPDFYGDEDGGEEDELPSGTRRVSRLHTRGDRPGQVRRTKGRRPVRARRRPPVHAQRTRHSWARRIASLVALVAAAALIWFLIELFQPFGTSPHGQVTVRIPPMSGTSEIGDQLERDGVISSSFFFKLRATLAGERSDMRSGTYHLQLGMSYASVLKILTRVPPAAKVTEVTITEGRTRKEIAALLRQQKVRGNYLAATRRSPLLNPREYGARSQPPSLEGFLFPDTYQLVVPVSASALAADQLRDFKRRFATVNMSYARRKHLTPYDVLKIASLVEAESATAHDRPLVASVVYNRLADGMMLQFDSTTRYATGNYNHPLTVSQLRSPSPWNTHTHFGLPPTPIGNPGLAAIQAAAHPARTHYLYFFAKPCSRGTVFATNYTQFLNQGRRYAAKRC